MSGAVVVTGIGAITPLGTGAEELFAAWSAERCAIADGIGRCDQFDAGEFLSFRELRRTERFTQMAIAACDEAVWSAGWGECVPFDPYRVACIIGTGVGALKSQGDTHSVDTAACSPLDIARMMPNAAAASISLRYGLHGPSAAVASACASGADAVALGVRLIRTAEVDAAIVGGSESAVGEYARGAFQALGATSKVGICRPFDARRDGFVIGEGAGVLVLESETVAEKRAAEVLARLTGIGVTCDGFHPSEPDPGAEAAARAIEVALADAGIDGQDIDYVNAHGTGGPLEDQAETRALKTALKRHAYSVPISSTKSAIGHLIGAAGAVEAVATVMALQNRIAPPTLGYEVPDEELDLDYNTDGCRPIGTSSRSLLGMSNSFGFGGHNVILVFEATAA